jgi:phosphonate transport system substrate-binding protein
MRASGPSDASGSDETEDVLTVSFGVYRTDKATVMYRNFMPVVETIQAQLEATLQRPVEVELQIYKTYDQGLEALVQGKVDFVRYGPASYVLAKQRNPKLRLLAMEQKEGHKRFKGVIVVSAGSAVRSLADLKGKSFAFGDENSTIGRYLAQAELIKAGVHSKDLECFEYLGRHDTVAKAVQIKDFDAGSLKIGTFEKMNADGSLRVLHSFDNVTKPWVARDGLDPKVFDALRSVLLAYDDEESLKSLTITGFMETSEEEYEFVRRGMKLAEENF